MCSRRISASWLSDDMAHALAAMCPPLHTADVLRAADTLTEHSTSIEVVVVDGRFPSDVDRVNLRNVTEALHALHDLGGGSLPAQRVGPLDGSRARTD
jgi:hypothetical protein